MRSSPQWRRTNLIFQCCILKAAGFKTTIKLQLLLKTTRNGYGWGQATFCRLSVPKSSRPARRSVMHEFICKLQIVSLFTPSSSRCDQRMRVKAGDELCTPPWELSDLGFEFLQRGTVHAIHGAGAQRVQVCCPTLQHQPKHHREALPPQLQRRQSRVVQQLLGHPCM